MFINVIKKKFHLKSSILENISNMVFIIRVTISNWWTYNCWISTFHLEFSLRNKITWKLHQGLGMWLSSRTLAYHVWGLGLIPLPKNAKYLSPYPFHEQFSPENVIYVPIFVFPVCTNVTLPTLSLSSSLPRTQLLSLRIWCIVLCN